MTAPFRKLSENPDISRAIESLQQASILLDAFTDNVRSRRFQAAASLLTSRSDESESLLSVLDQNHRALWTSISEARTRLGRAGFDVGPDAKTSWGGKGDIKAPAREIARLQALLPGVDFSLPRDDAVADYLAAQRRRRLIWVPLAIVVLVLVPVVALVLAAIFY